MKQNKLLTVILLLGIFTVSVYFFYSSLGEIVGLVGIIPILAAAWLYGSKGGVLTSLTVWLIATMLMFMGPIPNRQFVMLTIRSMVGLTIGIIVGLTREESKKLKKLEEETLALKLGIDKSKDIVFITDKSGIFSYTNPGFTRAYGYNFEEVSGRTPRILKSGYKDEKFYKDFWRRIESGESVQVDMHNMTKDGRMIEVESSVNPIVKETGEIIGYLAIQRDVTEKKNVEADLIKRTGDLERLNSIMIGREMKMAEMKKRIREQ